MLALLQAHWPKSNPLATLVIAVAQGLFKSMSLESHARMGRVFSVPRKLKTSLKDHPEFQECDRTSTVVRYTTAELAEYVGC